MQILCSLCVKMNYWVKIIETDRLLAMYTSGTILFLFGKDGGRGRVTPALRHDQVPKKESSKPSMNLRPQVHPHIRNRWQNLWRLRKKLFFFTFDQKMGQRGLKMGLKYFGLVWHVFVWLGCDQNWSEMNNRIQLCLL